MQATDGRARIRIVQSRANARLKALRAAFASSHPVGMELLAIEGEHLLLEAIKSGMRPVAVFVRMDREPLLNRIPLPATTEIIGLSPELFQSAMVTEQPQGIAALVEPPSFQAAALFGALSPLLLVLAGLQDPGNLGTLLRSAEAFGVSGIVALPGTVSPWNQKALRASSGSAFRMPFVRMAEDEALTLLKTGRIPVVAAVARNGMEAGVASLAGPLALLVGNEGAGLPARLIAGAQSRVTIPCPGPVESLNAAVAGSVLLYECARQRAESARQQADSMQEVHR